MHVDKHYMWWLAGATSVYRTKEASECTLLIEMSNNPWHYAHVALNAPQIGEGFGYEGDYWV